MIEINRGHGFGCLTQGALTLKTTLDQSMVTSLNKIPGAVPPPAEALPKPEPQEYPAHRSGRLSSSQLAAPHRAHRDRARTTLAASVAQHDGARQLRRHRAADSARAPPAPISADKGRFELNVSEIGC